MAKLSVNVNKIATLRNARGGNTPNVLDAVLAIERFGAHGITVHPRPDERHVKKKDVFEIARAISCEFNIEGYPSDEFLSLVEEIRPAQCTLVPDPPHVLTSNAGWLAQEHLHLLQSAVYRLHRCGVRVSLFIDPIDYLHDGIHAILATGTDRIELYTERYARLFGTVEQDSALEPYCLIGQVAYDAGLGVNAGHDLDLHNLPLLMSRLPFISEVSIGHALISDALYLGLEETVRQYLIRTSPQ